MRGERLAIKEQFLDGKRGLTRVYKKRVTLTEASATHSSQCPAHLEESVSGGAVIVRLAQAYLMFITSHAPEVGNDKFEKAENGKTTAGFIYYLHWALPWVVKWPRSESPLRRGTPHRLALGWVRPFIRALPSSRQGYSATLSVTIPLAYGMAPVFLYFICRICEL